MRVAVVDIGSAALALSLATVGDEGAISLLGEWALDTELVPNFDGEGTEKVLAGLKSFRHILRMQNPDTHLRAFVTSVLPEGAARDRFLRDAQGILDHKIELLTSGEEAALSFLASHDARAVPDGAAVVTVEIDGTATQIAVGDGIKLEDVFTLALGASSLTARFLAGVDPTPDAGLALSEHLHDLLNVEPVHQVIAGRPFHLVAAGPTVTALAALGAGGALERTQAHGATLELEAVFGWYQELLTAPAATVAAHLSVPVPRARTLLAGSGILLFLMEKLGASEVVISGNARRHGALREILGFERAFL